jgi:uncharacterized membrane protein YqjE
MEQLTEYILGFLEVAEKELKLFKALTTRTLKGLGWFFMGVSLLGIGLLVVAWTCYRAISDTVGAVPAGAASAVLILVGGGVFLWMSKKSLK